MPENKILKQTASAVPDPGKIIRKAIAVIRSFRVQYCELNIDTGNMPLNGILYPLGPILTHKTGSKISINFDGDTIMILKIQNTIARMLWVYLKS